MKDKLRALGDRAEAIREQLRTEEATKTALILPFLKELGYDVYNPLEVVPEYTADVGTKKGEKVDYAIMQNGNPVILVECKHWEEDLTKHGNQLFRYYSVTSGKKIGILTNGYHYMLFSDLDKPNVKDDKPFFEFNITHLLDSDIEEIAKLQKLNLDMDKIVDTANILKHTNIIKNILRSELQAPSEDFITYIAKRACEGPLTKNRYGFFEPLVKKSLRQIIDELFTGRLNRMLEQQNAQAAQEKIAAEADMAEMEDSDDIVTTVEELEGYAIVRAIACSVVPLSRIAYKDVKAYFGINLDGKVTKTFCRLYFGKTKKSIEISQAGQKGERFDIDIIEDIYKYRDHIRAAIKTYE